METGSGMGGGDGIRSRGEAQRLANINGIGRTNGIHFGQLPEIESILPGDRVKRVAAANTVLPGLLRGSRDSRGCRLRLRHRNT